MLLDLAGRFDSAYSAAKRERNVLDFNDLEHLALKVLLEEVSVDGESSQTAAVLAKGELSPAAAPNEAAFSRSSQDLSLIHI